MPEYIPKPLPVVLLRIRIRLIEKISGVPRMQFVPVTPQLLVGPQFRQAGKRVLEQSGVTASVNMRIEFDDAAHDLDFPAHRHYPTVDDTAPKMEDLLDGARFIREEIEKGGVVYIHCAGGLGRAPTMAVAYLLTQGHTIESAVALIEKTRPYIGIQTLQMQRLREYAEQIKTKGQA